MSAMYVAKREYVWFLSVSLMLRILLVFWRLGFSHVRSCLLTSRRQEQVTDLPERTRAGIDWGAGPWLLAGSSVLLDYRGSCERVACGKLHVSEGIQMGIDCRSFGMPCTCVRIYLSRNPARRAEMLWTYSATNAAQMHPSLTLILYMPPSPPSSIPLSISCHPHHGHHALPALFTVLVCGA